MDAMQWIDGESTWVLNDDTRGPAVLDHPISHIEPAVAAADEIRAARIKAVAILNQTFSQLQQSIETPGTTILNIRIRFWSICFALGLNLCGDSSLSSKARELSCTKQALSKAATDFSKATGLPSSAYLKRSEARKNYSRARRAVVVRSCNGNGEYAP